MSPPLSISEFLKVEHAIFLGHVFPFCLRKGKINQPYSTFKYGKIRIHVGEIKKGAAREEITCAKLALKKFYINEAKKLIPNRIECFAKICRSRPSGIIIMDRYKYWGGCTTNTTLIFNWRLMMLPMELIDYVVAHELCHLIHFNHSKNYWSLMTTIMPDYRLRKSWLKAYNGLILPGYKTNRDRREPRCTTLPSHCE